MKRRHLFGTVLGVVVILVGGLSWFGELFDGRKWCERSSEWASVRAQAQGLPGDLDSFLTIPIAYRQAVWAHLLPDVRSKIAQQGLERAASTLALSPEQSEAISFCKMRLTPEHYAEAQEAASWAHDIGVKLRTLNPPIVERAREAQKILRDAFSRDELSRILPRYMPQRYEWSLSLFRATVVATLLSSPVAALSADPHVCDCWDSSDCHGEDDTCYLFNCQEINTWPCGENLDLTCDNLCLPHREE